MISPPMSFTSAGGYATAHSHHCAPVRGEFRRDLQQAGGDGGGDPVHPYLVRLERTVNAARIAAQQLKEGLVHVLDTLTLSGGQTLAGAGSRACRQAAGPGLLSRSAWRPSASPLR